MRRRGAWDGVILILGCEGGTNLSGVWRNMRCSCYEGVTLILQTPPPRFLLLVLFCSFSSYSTAGLALKCLPLRSYPQSGLYPSYNSLPNAFRHLVATDGIRGLFRGFLPTAVRDAPYAGAYVVFYEEMKEILGRLIGSGGVPPAVVHTLSGKSSHASRGPFLGFVHPRSWYSRFFDSSGLHMRIL